MEPIKPMLFTTLKSYNGKTFVSDLVAGLIVAIIALPLSIALALASGVGPEEGIYTAIVAGFLISALGGSSVQIAGPTAAFATIVAGIVAKNGMEGLMLATILAGIILILMGVLRLGALIRYIPTTITIGFTAGIAVTIIIGQLKDFFGVTYPAGVKPIETMEKMGALIENFSTLNLWAVGIGLLGLAILILWPYISKKIPGSLIAVLVGAFVVNFFDLPVNTIGDLYTIRAGLPSLHIPVLSFGMIKTVLPDAFTIAILAAIESLLSCVVADQMAGTKHRSDTELVAQGIGNIGSALFGGIPATGAIARTAANIKNGGKTPVAGIVHAIILLLVLVVLMPYAALIPMPIIASILFVVAYNMCQWRPFVDMVKTAPYMDILVLILTFILTVVFDLVVAIAVGMIAACVLFMKRMSDITTVTKWEPYEEGNTRLAKEYPLHTHVYEIEGPLFFGSTNVISDISLDNEVKCIILRMRNVTALDASGEAAIDKLYTSCKQKGIRLILSHVEEQPRKALEKYGLAAKLGKENFAENIDEALKKSQE